MMMINKGTMAKAKKKFGKMDFDTCCLLLLLLICGIHIFIIIIIINNNNNCNHITYFTRKRKNKKKTSIRKWDFFLYVCVLFSGYHDFWYLILVFFRSFFSVCYPLWFVCCCYVCNWIIFVVFVFCFWFGIYKYILPFEWCNDVCVYVCSINSK